MQKVFKRSFWTQRDKGRIPCCMSKNPVSKAAQGAFAEVVEEAEGEVQGAPGDRGKSFATVRRDRSSAASRRERAKGM